MIIKEKEKITGDLIDDIILRSVDDLDFHRSPNNKYVLDVAELNDIKIFSDGVKLLYKHLLNNKGKIAVLMDNDQDGISSTVLLKKFFKNINTPLDVLIDKGKTHGITPNIEKQVLNNDYTLLIIPDAGSNNIGQHKKLQENGVDILVIDHHEIEKKNISKIQNYDTEHLVVINNQLLNINKEYTGAGMTYIFLKYVCFYENLDIDMDYYLDIVALGEVGDVADVSDKEIRYYVFKGFSKINNSFIKAVMKRKDIKDMTGRDASFSIISMINAVTRIGTIEEKRKLIDAFCSDSEETETVEIRKKNKKTGKFDKIPTEMTLQEIVVKKCELIKTKQDKIVKQYLNKVEYIYENNVIIGLLDDNAPSSLTGLIAMKIMDKERKPVMIGKQYDGYIAGSLRSPDGIDFKKVLSLSEYFEFVSGHSQAAGFMLKDCLFDDLCNYLDEYKFNRNLIYYVDRLYNKPNDTDVYSVEIEKEVFGGAAAYPMFGFEDIKFNKSCIRTRGSITTLFDNEVSFVLFNSPEDILEQINESMENNSVIMNIVGEPRVNNFGGKSSAQVVIKDYEFIKKEKMTNVFGIDF